jgi:two-component sensor histidine kinase
MNLSHPSLIGRHSAESSTEPQGSELLGRQFRHHWKNVLQRVIAEISDDLGLQSSAQSRKAAAQMVSRLCRAAEVSDQLFGSQSAAIPLADRLRTLGETLIAALGWPRQKIRLHVSVEAACPFVLHDIVLRVANEMITNAVRHGMVSRPAGQIEIIIKESSEGNSVLTVRDDGWGLLPQAIEGEGSRLIQELSAPYGGKCILRRCDGWTESVLVLPRVVAE